MTAANGSEAPVKLVEIQQPFVARLVTRSTLTLGWADRFRVLFGATEHVRVETACEHDIGQTRNAKTVVTIGWRRKAIAARTESPS